MAGSSSNGHVNRPAHVPILITDGEQRSALALVRSLGRRGYRVFVASVRPRSLAGASRHAAAQAIVPDPVASPHDFAARVRELCEQWAIRVLIPVSEAAALAVLERHELFEDVVLPMPELETFRRICDKQLVLEHAAQLGIRVPRQVVLSSREQLNAIEPASLEFPLVLKPARSVASETSHRIKLGVSYASDARELDRRLAEHPDAAFPILLQQRVQGPGIGVFLLLWQGRVIASFAHKRLREKPPSGGVSVYRESIALPDSLLDLSTDLLRRLEWTGVAMVEYKIDRVTQVPYLMEINGRFWGSLQLAIDAGVDFPALLVSAALGDVPHPGATYRLGVRSRWWWGDVDQLLTMLRRPRQQLALPAGAPGRLRSLLDFLILWRPGDRNEIFRWSDPMPFVRESIDWLAGR